MAERKASNYIVKKVNTEFNDLKIRDYENKFLELKSEGRIIGTFHGSVWEIPDEKINGYPRILNFDIEIYNQLNVALKAFILIQLSNKRTPQTLYNKLDRLKKVILFTNGFNDIRKLEIYLEDRKNNTKNQAYNISYDIKKFLEFYQLDNIQEILEICNQYRQSSQTQRDLPNFEHVMIFDEVINDYFQTNSIEETNKYLPIFVWWLITNILPQRPSEFVLYKKDCLMKDLNSSSPFKIIVPRLKDDNEEITYDIVDIDDKAYKLIQDAINRVNEIDPDSDYLFPTSILFAFRKINTTNRPKKNERINRRDFEFLKKMFYEEIVEEKYGYYDLDRIKNGDTRHFAIINMALQGFNMLSIARMAGHTELKTQHNYYSHAEHFAQSYVYRLAQFKIEKKISRKMNSGFIGWKRYVYDKGVTFSDIVDNENIVGRVDYGICRELKSIFPKTCIDDKCKFCNKYIFSPTLDEREEAIKWLVDSSKYLEQKIHESIELMKDLSKSLASTFRQGNSDLLKSTSKQLVTYMDQKVEIEAALMEIRDDQ